MSKCVCVCDDCAADNALYAFMKIVVDIENSNKTGVLARYTTHPKLLERFPQGFKVKMGFGLHHGWAIEGACCLPLFPFKPPSPSSTPSPFHFSPPPFLPAGTPTRLDLPFFCFNYLTCFTSFPNSPTPLPMSSCMLCVNHVLPLLFYFLSSLCRYPLPLRHHRLPV